MLSQRLIELRVQNKLIQQDMANYLGITRQAYGHYESGKRDVDTNTLIKLADKFQVTVDYLLGREAIQEDRDATDKKNANDFPFFDSNGIQFIARSDKNLSPEAYKKMQELAKRAAEIFGDKKKDS